MNLFRKVKKFYKEAYLLGHYPSISQLLLTNFKIFPYYGFLGDSNFGDELVFEATKELFKPNILIPIKKRMPPLLKLFCYFYKPRFSGIVIGGGTLIGAFWERDFFLSMSKFNKVIYVHGTGVHTAIENPEEWRSMLRGKVYGGVRGPLSVTNLAQITTAVNVAGDAAFAKFDEKAFRLHTGDKNRILLNLGTHSDFEGQDSCRLEVEKWVSNLISNGCEVCFLPLHEKDAMIGKKLKAQYPEITLLKRPLTYAQAASIFKTSSFALGERLHFTVMAILSKCPFFSINYSYKHEDLLASVNMPHAGKKAAEVCQSDLHKAYSNRANFEWDGIEKEIQHLKSVQYSEYLKYVSCSA